MKQIMLFCLDVEAPGAMRMGSKSGWAGDGCSTNEFSHTQ